MPPAVRNSVRAETTSIERGAQGSRSHPCLPTTGAVIAGRLSLCSQQRSFCFKHLCSTRPRLFRGTVYNRKCSCREEHLGVGCGLDILYREQERRKRVLGWRRTHRDPFEGEWEPPPG